MPLYNLANVETKIGTAQIGISAPAGIPVGYLTTGYATSAKTMPSYTSNPQSSAYSGGLLDLLLAAKLTDLNLLRVAVENQRVLTELAAQHVVALRNDLMSLGLIST